MHDTKQTGYRYERTEPIGQHFDPLFRPDLTPPEMLALGVFGGRYMRDCTGEFPKEWFANAKLHPIGLPGHDKHLNYFDVDASQSLAEWRCKGWIHEQDPRGWFQWYCRYYMGRRSLDDARQIKRWVMMRRHMAQIHNNCEPRDEFCRPRQRQALLHWAYDSRRI